MPMNSSTKAIYMNRNLGKLLLLTFIMLIFSINAQANRYCTYSLKASKRNDIVINEPISVSFFTKQKLHSEVMFFDFKAIKSNDYEIISVEEKRQEFNYHDAQKEFILLLFPKRAGELKVKFSFDIRRASDDAVKQAYVGSRDNVKSIPTIKVHIDTPILTINVKEPTTSVNAVGDFTLEMKVDKTESNSYDAVNVIYTLTGRGYLNPNYEPIKNMEGISIFRGMKQTPPRATKNGYQYNKIWSYALVKDESFQIKSVELKTYNQKSKRYTTLKTKSLNITINKLDVKNLLDDKEVPSSEFKYDKYIEYLYDILIFIAGFLFAKLLEIVPKKSLKKESSSNKVQEAKTAQELLKAAMEFREKVSLESEILRLEEIVYAKEPSQKLGSIKANIMKKIEISI